MYICMCQSVTENDIRRSVAEGVRNFESLREITGCSDSCGCCESSAREVLAEALGGQRLNLTWISAAA